jgi:beta-galactosidase
MMMVRWIAAIVLTTGLMQAAVARSADLRCEVKPLQGRPTLFVNGKPCFPMAFMSYYPESYRYKQMGQHGVHVYSVAWTLTDKWLGGDRPVKWNTSGLWRGPAEIDTAVIEKSLQAILDADPDALIFPRIYCDSPAWWDLLHPDETNGDGPLGGQKRRQSFSSLVWRNDTSETLKKIVRFVSASKFGGHVIGYMPTSGGTEELAMACETNACAQKAFRAWLLDRCGKDSAAVERRFGKSLDALAIPAATERTRADCGNFLDPLKSPLTIELRRFHSAQQVDSALAFCRAVKEASDGRLIAGFFYGYTMIWPDTGHLALRRALDCKDVDFITTAGGMSFTETDSVLRAGKLFYSEIDARTSLSKWISQIRPDIDPRGEYNEKRWFGPPTIPDSLQVLKGIYAKNLVGGWASWWFDLWGGWYDDEAFLNLFSGMQKVGDETLLHSRKSVAQVAVFLDEHAYENVPYGASQWGGKFSWLLTQKAELEKMGTPFDFFLQDDLASLDLSQYRMLVFLNPFVLSKRQRQTIRERGMAGGRLLVWLCAPGLIGDRLAAENTSSLLGMSFGMEPSHPKAKVALSLPEGSSSYEGAGVAPFLYVAAGADDVWGRTPEGRAVVAEKRVGESRNLFVSLPPLPWKTLQQFAKRAGVHIYAEGGGAVYANESYLAITASGKQKIRLPQKAALKEVLALRKGASAVDDGASFSADTVFEVDFADHPCRIFRVEK